MGHESLSESLNRTGAKSESVVGTAAGVELSQPIRELVKNDQWQRDGFTMLTSVPWERISSGVGVGRQKKACYRFPHPRRDATRPGAFDGFTASNNEVSKGLGLSTNPNVIGGDPTVRRVVKGSRSVGVAASEEQFATHLDTVQHIRQTAGLERCGRRRGGFFSKESSHTSLSVNPGPVVFGHWMESDAGPRRCNENQHAV